MNQWQSVLERFARLMGLDRGRRRAGCALAAVALFWVVGLLGGLQVLHGAASPLTTLVLLYVMLALVVLSFVVTAAAVMELWRQSARRRRR